jgi:hypothetical protein
MIFDPILDIFRGKAVTIPPMDGALKPNNALEEAAVLLEADAPDNLCGNGEYLFYSTGGEVIGIKAGADAKTGEVASFDVPVTALAALPGGPLAIGLDDGRLVLLSDNGDLRELAPPAGLKCPTALAFDGASTLYVCQGSARHKPSDWVVDLMEKGSSGSLWRYDLATGKPDCIAQGLAFPYGVLARKGEHGVVVSEAWRHRLVGFSGKGAASPAPILGKIAGYPARLSAAADGGAWLALFAPRNRLIEFTLLEDSYRADMMREMPRQFWIAPALSPQASFLEPLQAGGVKTMGVHKPWSPSRSYGLAVKLDAQLRPEASYHSRANGRRHGITAISEFGGRTLVAAKGGNVILDLGATPAGS